MVADRLEALREFPRIGEPAAEGGVVAVAVAESAVVDHQHLDAEVVRVVGQLARLALVHVHMDGLPGVDDDRAVAVTFTLRVMTGSAA